MLVIFDCDGVLVDSEWLGAQVFAQELNKVGLSWSAAECHSLFRGMTLRACFAQVEQVAGTVLPVDFEALLHAATVRAFEEDLQPVPGVVDVLQFLQSRGIAFCVASNGSRAKLKHSLGLVGLAPYFEGRTFSAQDVNNGKPAPDLFLLAAQTLGVDPAICTVVEDSIVGVTAAKAAGMRPLLFSEHMAVAENLAADCEVTTFTAMWQLPALITRTGIA